VAIIDFPAYRGSDERRTYVLPVPYVAYRGKFLKVDRERIRGLFFKNDKAELDVSLSGSVPVKSADNRARQGMPNLEPTLEMGPTLNLFLQHSARAAGFTAVAESHIKWMGGEPRRVFGRRPGLGRGTAFSQLRFRHGSADGSATRSRG
jgi:outer membrane scaffolding protein for murein synthesis (MipA/OmpV family)